MPLIRQTLPQLWCRSKTLEQGAKAVDDQTDQTTNVVFLTDSRSALDALIN